jgi:hypothetical protein
LCLRQTNPARTPAAANELSRTAAHQQPPRPSHQIFNGQLAEALRRVIVVDSTTPGLQNKGLLASTLSVRIIRRIHLQMLFRPLRHGTPASVRLKPGSARGPVGPGAWVAGPHYSAADAECIGSRQCIRVTANTTMMAALRVPMTASGTVPLRYFIDTPRARLCTVENVAHQFWFGGTV